ILKPHGKLCQGENLRQMFVTPNFCPNQFAARKSPRTARSARSGADARRDPRTSAHGHGERAALARLALELDVTAEHPRVGAANAQTETGPAVLSRGGTVALRERLEDLFPLGSRDSYAGVAHAQLERHVSRAG